jgi:RNA polymerase sigma factor (TIGR02999 family)
MDRRPSAVYASNTGKPDTAVMKNATKPAVSQLSGANLTRLLDEYRDGNYEALDGAFALVYAELRKLARGQLRNERLGHTLEATGLVHEAYLRLVGNRFEEWHGRAHFFGIAARAMRQILVEHARKRRAQKRGGEQHRTTLDDRHAASQMDADELLALDTALERLSAVDDRLRQVVELRFFCGLEDREIAALFGVSYRTIERDWAKARAWLYRELYPNSP